MAQKMAAPQEAVKIGIYLLFTLTEKLSSRRLYVTR